MDPAVLITLIISVTITIISLMTFILLRSTRNAGKNTEDESILLLDTLQTPEIPAEEDAVGRIDAAADAALDEINKTARLILDEIQEKYQAMLFLYNLLEEKKKEIAALTEVVEGLRVPAGRNKPSKLTVHSGSAGVNIRPVPSLKQAPRGNNINIRYERVKEMYAEGIPVTEIAKALNMGQGEVRLVIDLAERQG